MKAGLLITLRILIKNRIFTIITILNLTIGISACLMLMKYIRYERSFDKFYPQVDNVYRISYEHYQNGNLSFHSARTMSALAPAIKRDFPEIKEAIRGCYEECLIYIKEDNKFLNNQKVLWADDGFLDVFKLELTSGNPELALKEPYTAIISETQAEKLFGGQDPMGKTFWHNEGLVFKVTGIFKDIPQNTHLELDFIYSYITFKDWPWGQPEGNWGGNWLYTYILAEDGFSPAVFESGLNARVHGYMPDLESSNTRVKFNLQAVDRIHLDSNLDNEITINGDRKTLVILMIVALMIILISWINYINLLVVQNNDRAHEVGVRKVLGENRLNLFSQTLLTVFIINVLALFVSFAVMVLITPVFYRLFDLAASSLIYSNPFYWLFIIGIFLAGSLIIGLYPSLQSTWVATRDVLSKSHTLRSKKTDFKKVLVVVQFALSAILIFNVLVLSRQVNFMLSKDLGFNQEGVILLRAPETWCQTPDSLKSTYVERFRKLLLQYPEVKSISACNFTPGAEVMRHMDNLKLQNSANSQEHLSVPLNFIDNHYFETLEIEYLAGRSFREDFRLDRNCVILNESAMRSLGITDAGSAVNKILSNNDRELRIIAIVKDHNHLGIKNEIKPMVFFHRYAYDFGFVLVKTQGNINKAIQLVQKYWEEEFPVALFNYSHLNDFYIQQYKPEFRLRNSIVFFTLVAIILACVGLFSLLKYSLNSRIKEISIKRTLGASILKVLFKLSAEFLMLVAISVVIAFIISYFTAEQWLQNFAYRTNVNVWIFLVTGLLVLLASLLTVIWHVYKAAIRNPVIGLRDE